MTESGFTIDVDQNQFLPEGGRDVSAIVTVTSAADATGFSGAVSIPSSLLARSSLSSSTWGCGTT